MKLFLMILFVSAISIAFGLIIGYTVPSNQEFQLTFDDNNHLKKGQYEYIYLQNGILKQDILQMSSEKVLKLNFPRKIDYQIIYIDEFPYIPIKLMFLTKKAFLLN